MKKILYSIIVAALVTLNFTSCKEGAFGGDYKVGGVAIQDMCGTWVCTLTTCDPWYTANYYSYKKSYSYTEVNQFLVDNYGTDYDGYVYYNPDANGDGVVDNNDFSKYAEDDMLYDEGVGVFEVITSNTAANTSTEMLINDGFWEETYKTTVDYSAGTFWAGELTDQQSTIDFPTPVTLTKTYSNGEDHVVLGGQITKDGAIAPGSKMVTDKIDYYVKYANDYGPEMYYHITGYRKTGYTEDKDVPMEE